MYFVVFLPGYKMPAIFTTFYYIIRGESKPERSGTPFRLKICCRNAAPVKDFKSQSSL